MLDTSSNWRWRVQRRGLSCRDASSCSPAPGLCCPRYSLSNASPGAVFLMCVLIVVSSWTAAPMFPVHRPPLWSLGVKPQGAAVGVHPSSAVWSFLVYIWDQQGTRLAQCRFVLQGPCSSHAGDFSRSSRWFFYWTYLWPPHALYLPENNIIQLLRLCSISEMFPSESQTTSVPTPLSRLPAAHLLSLNLSLSEYLLQEMVVNFQMYKNL